MSAKGGMRRRQNFRHSRRKIPTRVLRRKPRLDEGTLSAGEIGVDIFVIRIRFSISFFLSANINFDFCPLTFCPDCDSTFCSARFLRPLPIHLRGRQRTGFEPSTLLSTHLYRDNNASKLNFVDSQSPSRDRFRKFPPSQSFAMVSSNCTCVIWLNTHLVKSWISFPLAARIPDIQVLNSGVEKES